jgi:hypothetical protein
MSCMSSIQYSLRQVPIHVDRAVKEHAARYGRSMNSVALDALEKGLGLGQEPVRHHDLDLLAGTWVEDEAFDQTVAGLRKVDRGLWK